MPIVSLLGRIRGDTSARHGLEPRDRVYRPADPYNYGPIENLDHTPAPARSQALTQRTGLTQLVSLPVRASAGGGSASRRPARPGPALQ